MMKMTIYERKRRFKLFRILSFRQPSTCLPDGLGRRTRLARMLYGHKPVNSAPRGVCSIGVSTTGQRISSRIRLRCIRTISSVSRGERLRHDRGQGRQRHAVCAGLRRACRARTRRRLRQTARTRRQSERRRSEERALSLHELEREHRGAQRTCIRPAGRTIMLKAREIVARYRATRRLSSADLDRDCSQALTPIQDDAERRERNGIRASDSASPHHPMPA